MKQRHHSCSLFGLLLFFLTTVYGCKPSVPGEYIQPKELGDILYEYHLAEGMTMLKNDSIALYHYKNSILEKHGISSEEFDLSMNYYMRHADELKRVYESLSERFSAEAKANGSTFGDIDNAALNNTNGDTVNVWRGARSFILTPYKPSNLFTFTIQTDSTYHKGDKLLFNFDSQFIYQDGVRDGLCVIAVKFNNDSITSQTLRITSTTASSLQFDDSEKLGIKEIKGFFLLGNSSDFNTYTQTTLRLMAIANLRCIRIHPSKNESKPKKTGEPTDTLPVTVPQQTPQSIEIEIQRTAHPPVPH